MDEHVLDAIGASGVETIGLFTSDAGDNCQIICIVRGSHYTIDAGDFFDALCLLRRQILEPLGLIPCCFGASLTVWPSGMARSMGRGLMAYIIEIGEPGGELVDIFDTADGIVPATVDEQERYAERWSASLRH